MLAVFRSRSKLLAFRRALLTWYDANQRPLPWRRVPVDAYRVWISEIMLQQTRVAAVVQHYERFMARFPNLRSLANAKEADVLAVWSGLGYYRRARSLHQAARQIARRMDGVIPASSEKLLQLPGIGRYTAAAIASIAFGEPIALVDGNVERVLLRTSGKHLCPSPALWTAAQQLLALERPGDFNQAMMELGAMVCSPRDPQCQICPIRRWCATQGVHPRLAPARRRRTLVALALVKRKDRIRLCRRKDHLQLMPGMWELPPCSAQGKPAFTMRHSVTTTDYFVNIYVREDASMPGRWVPIAALNDLPLTGLTRKTLRKAGIL